MIIQARSRRKASGGRYKKLRARKKYMLGREPTLTKIGETSLKIQRGRGGSLKFKLLQTKFANIYNPKTKKSIKAEIKSVTENRANPQFVRSNIITKGAVINTDKGKARVTSRPGQEGIVNAVLLE